MKARNPQYAPTPAALQTQIQSVMNSVAEQTFDELRSAILDLVDMPDNEIAQAVVDAGFVVEFQSPNLEQ